MAAALPSRIDAVTDFRRAAVMERVAEIGLSAPAAFSEVRRDGLPLAAATQLDSERGSH